MVNYIFLNKILGPTYENFAIIYHNCLGTAILVILLQEIPVCFCSLFFSSHVRSSFR